ncbi:hypothetical protein [Glycocaulis sp.]|uniref:hypothetical protein n=1 Tax=Glycocaulis sp. TaxID=1969725 RepID=UPI003D25F3A2
MFKPVALILAAGLGLAGVAASAAPAEAQRWHQPRGWSAPQGHFVVNANACTPLRHYHQQRSRHHAQWNRQRNYVLRCQPGAFNYIPTRAEMRMGVTNRHVTVSEARWDPRRQRFFAETRWGRVPVEVIHAPIIIGRR